MNNPYKPAISYSPSQGYILHNQPKRTQIPVYELHDGEAYDGFIHSTTANIEPTRNGVRSAHIKTTLKRVPSRYGYQVRQLPMNYKHLSKAQVVEAMNAAKFNHYYVSTDGKKALEFHGIPTNTVFNNEGEK